MIISLTAVWHQTTNCFDLKLLEAKSFHFLQIKLDKTKKQTQKTNSYFAANLRQFDIKCPNDLSPNWRKILEYNSLFFAFQNQKSHSKLEETKWSEIFTQFDIKRQTVLISNCQNFQDISFPPNQTRQNKANTKNKLLFCRNLRQFDIKCQNDLSPNWRNPELEFVFCISKSKISFALEETK